MRFTVISTVAIGFLLFYVQTCRQEKPAGAHTSSRAGNANLLIFDSKRFNKKEQSFFQKYDIKSSLAIVPGFQKQRFATPGEHESFVQLANRLRCPCGCNFTLAQCRKDDQACDVSGARLETLLASVEKSGHFWSEAAVPPVSVPLLTPGPTRFDLSAHEGKVAVIAFWATWCTPCKHEIPIFNRIWRERKSRNVTLIALAVEETLTDKQIQGNVKSLNIEYPVARATAEIQRAYFAAALPTTVIVDINGFLYRKTIGAESYEDVARLIEEANSVQKI